MKKFLNNDYTQRIALLATVVFSAYVLIGNFLIPYSWYVELISYKAQDACVGDKVIIFETERYPRWGILGETYAQIVRYNNIDVIETSIHRGSKKEPVTFGYEPSTKIVKFETKWFEKDNEIYIWTEPGTYGANEWVTIYPLPLVSKSKFLSADNNKFNVVNCN